jgi:hypothetical protein
MPSQIVMPYRGALPCPIDISSTATVLYYKLVGVRAAVSCHAAAAGPVALRWVVSNAAADGLLLLVALAMVLLVCLLCG